MIEAYTNHVFTNNSCGDVQAIAKTILDAKPEIEKVDGLQVISGYHGTSPGTTSAGGDYSHDFTEPDLELMINFIQDNFAHMKNLHLVLYMESQALLDKAKELAKNKSFTLVCHQGKGMPGNAIKTGFAAGNIFFTWCYSNTKLQSLGLIP